MVISFSDNVSLEMIEVAPGTFTMGSPTDELGREKYETQHDVTLQQGFWLGKYEVTQAQYLAVMGYNPSKFKGDNFPVEHVSWNDATNFCAKLTMLEKASGRLLEGYEYALPTEAQWEYACRAGTVSALHSGNDLTSDAECPYMDEVGWYKYNSNSTHPVGEKQPNAWGFYDMHGNVVELCLDWYPGLVGEARSCRGGSYHEDAKNCRSAWRHSIDATEGYVDVGFRIALIPVQNVRVAQKIVHEIPVGHDIVLSLPNMASMELLWVNPGRFMMGSPEDELGRWDDEVLHQVTIIKGFLLGKYEVTQAQYQAVMGNNPSKFKGDNLPVESVSWHDATNFCAKLTEIEKNAGRLPIGYKYALPTEAQWEYACRAGTVTALNNGKNLTSEKECRNVDVVGWQMNNSDSRTQPVGQMKENAWGFYDMHGNVWEWCLDWYGDYPLGGITDPTGPVLGSNRVLRGGGWSSVVRCCRSAFRGNSDPNDGGGSHGFRVALVPVR